MKKKPKPSETVLLQRRALKLARSQPDRSFIVMTLPFGGGVTVDTAGRASKTELAAYSRHGAGMIAWNLGQVTVMEPKVTRLIARGEDMAAAMRLLKRKKRNL